MHPILFQIGSLKIYSYGVMLAVGFCVSIICARKQFIKVGIDKDFVIDFAVVVLFWAIIGSRFLYILTHFQWFIQHPVEIIMLHRGGLIYYGGIISAVISGFIFTYRRKVNPALCADTIVPYVALGQFFGRIGCFLNGCCWGKPTDCILAVTFPGHSVGVHPVQLYEAILVITLFFILRKVYQYRKFNFQIFLLYFIGYGFIRFFLEFFRGDNPEVFMNMTLSQIISLAIFVIAGIAYKICRDAIYRVHERNM